MIDEILGVNKGHYVYILMIDSFKFKDSNSQSCLLWFWQLTEWLMELLTGTVQMNN